MYFIGMDLKSLASDASSNIDKSTSQQKVGKLDRVRFRVSSEKQFKILFIHHFLHELLDVRLCVSRLAQLLVMGLLSGLIFGQLPNSVTHLRYPFFGWLVVG